jgi:hypothetical protein
MRILESFEISTHLVPIPACKISPQNVINVKASSSWVPRKIQSIVHRICDIRDKDCFTRRGNWWEVFHTADTRAEGVNCSIYVDSSDL